MCVPGHTCHRVHGEIREQPLGVYSHLSSYLSSKVSKVHFIFQNSWPRSFWLGYISCLCLVSYHGSAWITKAYYWICIFQVDSRDLNLGLCGMCIHSLRHCFMPGVSFFIPGWPQIYYVAQVGLKSTPFLLTPSLKCWDHRSQFPPPRSYFYVLNIHVCVRVFMCSCMYSCVCACV